jgi:hypothetical protein
MLIRLAGHRQKFRPPVFRGESCEQANKHRDRFEID